ncbi:hypothetical protein PINS_up010054 [Pythium insidiosum]|nr:hypothetical protein PINS_up010054 [Pythium insidiosum]
MAGIKFLNLKGWHPSNARNQKRIWIAEQQAKAKQQREQEAATEVRRSAELQKYQQLAVARGDTETAQRLEQEQVGFLYAPPPGLEKAENSTSDAQVAANEGDDDAVRAFRKRLETRPLERYVGRKADEPLTIQTQVERFPFLKDAPVEGEYTASVKVNFKPVGVVLRNVRCLRCSEWGHQSGDRECPLRDVNPLDAARQAREDPMALMAAKKNELVLRKAAMPLEMRTASGADDSNPKDETELLVSSGEDEGNDSDVERAFLAQLSTKEKRRLLKKLRAQSKKEKKQKKHKRHKDAGSSKRRRRHHHHRDDSSGSSSSSESSSSDSESESRHRSKRRRRSHRDGRDARSRSRSRGGAHDDDSQSAATPRRPRSRSRSRSRSRNRSGTRR